MVHQRSNENFVLAMTHSHFAFVFIHNAQVDLTTLSQVLHDFDAALARVRVLAQQRAEQLASGVNSTKYYNTVTLHTHT